MVGDTDSSDELLTDDEVDAIIAEWTGEEDSEFDGTNLELAGAVAAETIAAKFARGYDVGMDNQTFNRSQRVNHYRLLAADLRSRASQQSISTA